MNTEQHLREALRTEADRFGTAHPIGLDEVRTSARTIRRRRRGLVVGVVATITVLAVPLGMAVTRPGDDLRLPVATQSPTQSPSQNPTGTTDVPVTRVTLKGLDRGADPAVAWIENRTLHLAGGGTMTMPYAYQDVAAYHGGWLGQRTDGDGDVVLDTLDADGKVTRTVPSGWGFARNPEGTLLAWVEQGAIKRGIASGMGEGEASIAAEGDGQPEVFGMSPDGEVYYNVEGDPGTVYRTDFETTTKIEGAIEGRGVSATGAFSVQTKSLDAGSCSEVRQGSTRLWDTCDWLPTMYSADGRYVLGRPAYLDGGGDGVISVIEAGTGRTVRVFKTTRDSFISDVRWDGDRDALLARVYQDGVIRLVRLSVDGVTEATSEPVESSDPFGGITVWLTSQP